MAFFFYNFGAIQKHPDLLSYMTCSVTVTQVALKSGNDASSNATEHPAAAGKTDRSASVCDDDVSTKEPRKKRRKLEEDGDGRHLQEPSASVGRWMLQVYSELISTQY